MCKKEPDLVNVIMATILGFILLFCLVFYGCANIRKTTCKALYKVVKVAETAHEKDPNVISQGDVDILTELRNRVCD